MIKKYEGYAGIVSERDMAYKVVGENLDPKTNLLTSIIIENILSVEKVHRAPKRLF